MCLWFALAMFFKMKNKREINGTKNNLSEPVVQDNSFLNITMKNNTGILIIERYKRFFGIFRKEV